MSAGPTRRRILCAAAGSALGIIWHARAQGERVIAVTARKFVFVPNEIAIGLGESVVIELSAPEVTMGFNAPDFGIRQDIVPGIVTRVRLAPTKAGRFQFNCDVFCGSGHEDMDGVIVVT
jgi:cytochrome c oxidase subunit 2